MFGLVIAVGIFTIYEISHIADDTFNHNVPLKIDWHLEKQDRMNYLIKYCPNGNDLQILNNQLNRENAPMYNGDGRNPSIETIKLQIHNTNKIKKLILFSDKQCAYSKNITETTKDMALLDYAGAMYFDKLHSLDGSIILNKQKYKKYCFIKHASLHVLNNLIKHSNLPIIRNRALKMKRNILKEDKRIKMIDNT